MHDTKKKLTKKQRGFVKDYIATENGVQSALANYDTKDYKTASVIAAENLDKPYIRSAIQEALKDDVLAEKHTQLLNAVTLERLTFDINDTDEDIEDVVCLMPGYKLLKIIRRLNSSGDGYESVFAYVKAPDSITQDKALDKAYKIKGSYAAEKHAHAHINTERIIHEVKLLNDV